MMRCKRLAEKFNQPAEKYKQVVKDNHAMRFHELVRHLIDIGMEKKENCQWKKEDWEGRKHHPWHHGHHGNHCHHGDWHKHRGHHSKSGERSDEQKCPKKDCVQKC